MNIVSLTVTGALLGLLGPTVAQMSLQPIVAQKRAQNFGVAESRAVAYSALNEGAPALTPLDSIANEGCNVTGDNETNAFSVTCNFPVEQGSKYRQSVTRSFRLAPIEGGSGTGYTAPKAYTPGIYCPLWDAWGVQSYNAAHNVQCIPVPYGPWASTYTGEMLW